ncbi:hypothetical protein NPD5_2906 [Clostridium sporogenes]|uniref:Uncharacterized protein n=1 Tax=Clostridium sporogenes TaxID=1509 RepID=A0A1L3NII2_CLOSG|nr:hypothetical protein [Clostridium sporogenes]APH15908.1 hypothetical protein NPD5_2906 [Clostridium sporogenes]
MPLRTIPLCTVKYVGDNFCSGTFMYDTTNEILKHKEKLFYKNKVVEIDKVKGYKLLYKHFNNIEKKNHKYLYKENAIIAKEFKRDLEVNDKEINKNKNISLEDTSIIEFNKKKNIELDQKECIHINIEIDKNLLKPRNIELNRNNTLVNLNIDIENLTLSKFKDIYTEKIMGKLSRNRFIKKLKLYKNIYIEKQEEYMFLNNNYLKKIHMHKLKFAEKYGDRDIDKNLYIVLDRINFRKIDIVRNLQMLKKLNIRDTWKSKCINNLKILNIKKISKDYDNKLMYKKVLKNIWIYEYIYDLDRISIKSIDRHKDRRYFYRQVIRTIDKEVNKCLDRKAITFIFKENRKYLDYMSLITIYKHMEKDLLDLTIWDIDKEQVKHLQGTLIKSIYKVDKNNKFIEVTKRWWWLRSTNPTDKLIIPNKDFIYNSDLLNNLDYEYLRYNGHPVKWGKDWGVDHNIPTYAVSVEIMLDLVNILMMIWNKNIQGWLSCSGKEAIQFVMELLYDWYTLDTSSLNIDYIRTYRWIRWEAERVYFLDTKNGLQAIGLLIANLIDYLKQHHFNLVPVWHNPKAMDIEREFNKVATNGDIMKDLDKLKGKRNYMVEMQNFEKKNIFGR